MKAELAQVAQSANASLQRTLERASVAVDQLSALVGESLPLANAFEAAVDAIAATKGRLIVCGIGKS